MLENRRKTEIQTVMQSDFFFMHPGSPKSLDSRLLFVEGAENSQSASML